MLTESAFEENLTAHRQQQQDDAGLPLDFKCVLVGDTGIGKTTLGMTFMQRSRCFQVSKTFEPFQVSLWIDDSSDTMRLQRYMLQVHDMDASEEAAHLRPLIYGQDTDLYLVCFAVNQCSSFDNVRRWVDEIQSHHTANHLSPPCIVVVGLKRDLRESSEVNEATEEHQLARESSGVNGAVEASEGHRLARELSQAYVECSALGDPMRHAQAFRNDGPASVFSVFEVAVGEVKKRTLQSVIEKKRRQIMSEDFAIDSSDSRPRKCAIQ